MFSVEEIGKAQAVCVSAFNVSMLSDAMTLHRFMDVLCVESVDISQESGYDDNNYFTYHELSSVHFDDQKLEQKGGLSYLIEALRSEFNVIDVDAESLEELKDYINSYEFLKEEPVSDMVDFSDIVRINSHETQVSLEGLAKFVERCLREDVPTINAKLQALAA